MVNVESIDSKKLRGGYYTPQPIADFICKWAIQSETKSVLEPSCGDGNFVESIVNTFKSLNVKNSEINKRIKAIELVSEEANKAKARVRELGISECIIENSDFFHFLLDHKNEAYDVVVGNPPFIRYQNFPEEHRNLAFDMMFKMGLSPNKLMNIWASFLVVSASLLKEKGKLGMVIPAELFQVKYAAETRVFLSKFFSNITIITFKKLVFEDIQQEVVLLLCDKDPKIKQGIKVIEVEDINELIKIDWDVINKTVVKSLDHSSEKWTKYFLDEKEIQLLRKIKVDTRVEPASSVMEVRVGIVTGRNEFFMLNKEQISQWKLENSTKKVVGRSVHLKGVIYDDSDFNENVDNGYPVNMFLPEELEKEKLPLEVRDYIDYGEKNDFHTGYKCKIRKLWYITPSLWKPDAFALRQVGDYPKLIVNNTDASCTDTLHRIRMKKEGMADIIALSFLNSLTFAFTEIMGRSYGGGVLTFEPSELEELPLPILNSIEGIDIKKVDELIRMRKIEEVLNIIDHELLIVQLKLSQVEVNALRNIWRKLSNRRNNRKK
ncbi:MAG: N-6 DNA methylase [Flavobacteriaceae bacterium]|jgi:adenine-specific DNA-methyltransferase|nr:N-6 DNA methylase [Flavobacteriaceae bacterium]